jgi:hypothetical protein
MARIKTGILLALVGLYALLAPFIVTLMLP